MLKKFESMWDVHLRHINVARHCIDMLNKVVGLVYYAQFHTGLAARKFAATVAIVSLNEKLIEPAAIE